MINHNHGPIGNTCTSFVEDDMPPCGEVATTERDGEPRCAAHAFEDDASWYATEDYRAFLRSLAPGY